MRALVLRSTYCITPYHVTKCHSRLSLAGSSGNRSTRFMTQHGAAPGVMQSRHWWSRSRRVIMSNPKSRLCISTYPFYLFKSGILLTDQSGLLMRVISAMLWVTLILNTVHESLVMVQVPSHGAWRNGARRVENGDWSSWKGVTCLDVCDSHHK